MKSQSRGWWIASLAATLLFALFITQLDKQTLFHHLQAKLAETGIQLEAEDISISFMYTGSIQLSDVHIQTNAFNADAKRLFIELNLAALLTGSAIPQALYLQLADVDVFKNQENEWLELMASKAFKLKRIDISQSTIHFEEQHLTLEQVNLDIRDIGKNKNPRLELRAHIGEGRLDAHGFLRLKRGEVTQGFGRLKIYDVPLSAIKHNTTLETLNGSITTHLNPNNSWQSFGHLSLQERQKDKLELRGKITGNEQQFLYIEDMVLTAKEAGAFKISGKCIVKDDCDISLKSSKFNLTPLFELTGSTAEMNRPLEDVQIETSWKSNEIISSGHFSWNDSQFTLPATDISEKDSFSAVAGYLEFEALLRDANGVWSLPKMKVFTQDKEHLAVTLTNARYENNHWALPFQLYDTELWLPMAKAAAMLEDESPLLNGNGTMRGFANLEVQNAAPASISFSLDAKDAEVQWGDYLKPREVITNMKGDIKFSNQEPEIINLSIQADDAYASVSLQKTVLSLNRIAINFDHLKELGIRLEQPYESYHGYIMGNAFFNQLEPEPQSANIEVIDFGKDEHTFSGSLQKDKNKWKADHLLWAYRDNRAYISTNRRGAIHIDAERLDTESLNYFLHTPLHANGTLKAKSLSLPIGTFKDVSSTYHSESNHIALKRFRSTFHEGTVRSKALELSSDDDMLHISGPVQLGGVRIAQWSWLQKQFQYPLRGSLYTTLNLSGAFDNSAQLFSWKGDGDIMVYNAKWLFEGQPFKTDKLSISMRKREQFKASLKMKTGLEKGLGKIHLDEKLHASGYLEWQNESYSIMGQWPNLSYSINPTKQTIQESIIP